MTKQIKMTVTGEYISVSPRVVGAVGAYQAAELAITFDGAWDGTAKKIYMTNATGDSSVVVLLTLDMMVDGAYVVAMPAEPLSAPGNCTINIRGTVADGDDVERVIVATETQLQVLSARIPGATNETIAPTPSDMDQLEAALEGLTGSIGGAMDAKTAAEAAAVSAAGDAVTAGEKADIATSAANTATQAKSFVTNMTVSSTTGQAGEPANVIKTNSASGYHLGFVIPMGKDGEPGEQGVQGVQGVQGPQGIQGERGLNGTAVAVDGIFAFNVDDSGHLILSYEGESAPDFEINENGRLIYTF